MTINELTMLFPSSADVWLWIGSLSVWWLLLPASPMALIVLGLVMDDERPL